MFYILHMHGNSHRTQVAHPHYTANDIPAKVVKNKDFPDCFSILPNGRGCR